MASPVLSVRPLSFPWVTTDPFLFCAHHDDAYPAGDEAMAPAASLAGRDLGQDFSRKDGFSMYHGQAVPGFPQHPHRGFETVTLVRSGYIDHSDSLGATARFGPGDAQWLTAGEGIVHSEMFPLVHRDKPNPLELFQIWLNLPAKDKLVPPHFSMLWAGDIPTVVSGEPGHRATVTVVAGDFNHVRAPKPPPHSWAAHPEAHVAIWSIRLEPGSALDLPAADPSAIRSVYFFAGSGLTLGDHVQPGPAAMRVKSDVVTRLSAGEVACEVLVLQGRPLHEPVAQHGPFVMNTRAELEQAFADYRRTRFGGWTWEDDAPVHPRDAGRFARRPGGEDERPAGER